MDEVSMKRAVWFCIVAGVSIGCGGMTSPADAGPGRLDGAVPSDAAAPDGSAPADAAAAADAGPTGPDGDSDGVPASLDCDDSDPAIGSAWTRSCPSDCDPAASESCVDGVWGECVTGPSCVCASSGSTRVVDCAMCGTRGQTCTLGMWTNSSECLGGGACEAGAVEMRIYRCAMAQRLCGADCSWGEWTAVSGTFGECDAGERQCGLRSRICDEMCMWRGVTFEECDAG